MPSAYVCDSCGEVKVGAPCVSLCFASIFRPRKRFCAACAPDELRAEADLIERAAEVCDADADETVAEYNEETPDA